MEFTHLRRRLILAVWLGLMVILAAVLALSARRLSPTWNEPDHLFAGYRYWQSADFAVNSEHPPLVKFLAAFPLLPLRLKVPQIPQGPSKFEANLSGRKFLLANDARALVSRARLAVSLLTLLLAALLFEAALEMFGPGPAFLALVLFVSEPNLLAHGALVTTDAGLAGCLFATVFAFYRYTKQPSRVRLGECGIAAGLVLAAKHSGIFVFPILGLLGAAEFWLEFRRRSQPGPIVWTRRAGMGRHAFRLALALVAVAAVALTVLWATYGFRYSARPGNLRLTPSLAEALQDLKSPAEARLLLGLSRARALPEAYLYGLTDVLISTAGPRPMFLLGKLYARGRWFYFPAAFLIKSTLGFLLLLLAALPALLRSEKRREVLFLAIPALAFFAFSLTSGLNIGVRHILPVYPFLIVLAAAGGWSWMAHHRVYRYLIPALMGLHVASSARAFPDYLAYSNELFGGPAGTYRVLSDSNVDWGQGLEATKQYLDRRGIRNCWLAYFGSADPDGFHIPCKILPDPFSGWWEKPVDVLPQFVQGTVLISATELAGTYWGPGELNPYHQFQKMHPLANLAGSILVFEGRFDMTGASTLSHSSRSWELVAHQKLDQALAEARTAVDLAPRSVAAQSAFGHALRLTHHAAEARRAYETALTLAETIHPEYQEFWIPFLRDQLAHL